MTNPKNWNALQEEITSWAQFNFPNTTTQQLFWGIQEEIGEFFTARMMYGDLTIYPSILHIVNGQIRKTIDQMFDAIGDQCIYAINLCQLMGIKFGGILNQNRKYVSPEYLFIGIGEVNQAYLKISQNIRKIDKNELDRRMIEFIKGWSYWATSSILEISTFSITTPNYLNPTQLKKFLAKKDDLDLFEITTQVWEDVKKRNWVLHPDDAQLHVK